MRRFVTAALPVLALSLVGCGGSNPPARTPTLSQEQIDAEEQRSKEVSASEKQHEKLLPKANYVPREEAAINEAEGAREAALRAARTQNATPPKR